MDFGSLALGVGSALAVGAGGSALGKSRLTGDVGWNRVLGPAGAILGPIIVRKLGVDLTEQEIQVIALAASGVFEWAKSGVRLFRDVGPRVLPLLKRIFS